MISVDEYEKLVFDLLEMERYLNELGQVRVQTAGGEKYAMFEQLLANTVPQQKEYNDFARKVAEQRSLVEAHDRAANYALAASAVRQRVGRSWPPP